MKDNANVTNDIFHNDNNKNRTKTILLLTIVAVILIAVFLIIAWVMTRDNSLQISNKNTSDDNSAITSQSPNIVPRDPNIGDNSMASNALPPPPQMQNPLGLGLSNNDTVMPNNNMSDIPPTNIMPNSEASLSGLSNAINASLPSDSKNADSKGKTNYENDPRFQQNLKDIEKKHAQKNQANTANKTQDTKKNDTRRASNVIKSNTPKETIIAQAPDPTKQTQKAKDSKDTKKPSDTKATSATNKPQATKSSDTRADSKPKDSNQDPKVVQANTTNAQNAKEAETPATGNDKHVNAINVGNDKNAQDKIIHRTIRPTPKDQGKEATKGHYIQVGVFSQNKIDQIFLNNIAKYSYRTKTEGNNRVRYLIGPYESKTEANRELQNIRTEINSGAFYFFVN